MKCTRTGGTVSARLAVQVPMSVINFLVSVSLPFCYKWPALLPRKLSVAWSAAFKAAQSQTKSNQKHFSIATGHAGNKTCQETKTRKIKFRVR